MDKKNIDIITAWANGNKIEYQSPTTDEWFDVPSIEDLAFDDNYRKPRPLHPSYNFEYRIKPGQFTGCKHKNSEVIIAWANGFDIQYKSKKIPLWFNIPSVDNLCVDNFFLPSPINPEYAEIFDWRVKP